MVKLRWLGLLSFALFVLSGRVPADEPPPPNPAAGAAPAAQSESVEQLTERVRKSIAVITSAARDGHREGLGSGFVVSADGLIATNFHVIGENRALRVQLANGREYDATAIHASDRQLDLAIVRIDAA